MALSGLGAQTPLPSALGAVADLVLQSDIRKLLETDPIDLDRLPGLLAEAQARDGRILDPQISFVAKNRHPLVELIGRKPVEHIPLPDAPRFNEVNGIFGHHDVCRRAIGPNVTERFGWLPDAHENAAWRRLHAQRRRRSGLSSELT